MSGMREKLARVLARADCGPLLMTEIAIGLYVDKRWEEKLPVIDTLLAILREPDEEMKMAGASLSYQGDAFAPIECIEDAWQAMIDTIAEPARNQPTA